MAVGVDELDFYQASPLVRSRRKLGGSFATPEEPPPGSLGAYAAGEVLQRRRRQVIAEATQVAFFGPPFFETDLIVVVSPHSYRRRQKSRTNFFPEYPVPTLYRPCELEVLQVPTNPYARLHRHMLKAIIYMRTTYKGDPTC